MTYLLTGAHLVLYVNGKPWSVVKSCVYTLDTPHKETRGLDAMEAFELDPTVVRCSGTMSVYRVGRSGGAEGGGLAVPPEDLPNAKYFGLAIIDRRADSTVLSVRRAVVNSQSWSNEVRGLVSGQISFAGTGWQGEVPPVTAPPQS